MIGFVILGGIFAALIVVSWLFHTVLHNTVGRAGTALLNRFVNRSNAEDLERFKRGT